MAWLTRWIDPSISTELYGQRRPIVLGLICSAVVASLGGAMIWFIKLVIAAFSAADSPQLVRLSGMVIVLFAVKYWFTRGQSLYLTMAANSLTASLRIKLFRKLQRLPISYFNDKRSGAIQSVLTNDVSVYQSAVTLVKDSVDGPIKVFVGIVTIFVLSWKLSIVSLLILPLVVAVIQRNARKMKEAQIAVQSDLSTMTAMMQESLQGTRVIKAFNAEPRIVDRFSSLVNQTLSSQLRAAQRLAQLKPLVELIGSLGIALVVLTCSVLVRSGEFTVDKLSAFLFALDYINQGFRNLGSLNQTRKQIEAASKRINDEILDVPEPLVDDPEAITLPKFSGRIEFRDVSFNYPDGTAALRKVNFVLEPGTSLALVGPSGAGKSTIADLLLRFYDPTEGEILFDGVDIRTVRSSWLRDQIGVVPQQTFLFAGSISDNIRLGREGANDAEIQQAVHAAHAQFVESMPNGYATELGERGVRLSGGEAQRLAIARAFVRRPRLLLLDEATSNLDSVSERAVQEALDEIMVERSTVMIAHRLSSAARCSKIVVLRRGEVVEQGPFADLMASGGAFAGMYKAYSQGLIDGDV